MQPTPGIQKANFTPTFVILDRKKCPGYCWYYYVKDAYGNESPTPISTDNVIVGWITGVSIKPLPDNNYLEDALQVSLKAEKTYVLRTGGRSRQQGTVPVHYKGFLRSLYYAGTKLGQLVAIETTPSDQSDSVIFVNVYTDLVCDNEGKIVSGTKVEYDYHGEEARVPDPRFYIDQISSNLNTASQVIPQRTVSAPVAPPVAPIGQTTQTAQPEAILPPQVIAANNRAPVQMPVKKSNPASAPALKVNPIANKQQVVSGYPAPTREQVEMSNLIKEAAIITCQWTDEGLNRFLVNKYNVILDDIVNLTIPTLEQIYGAVSDQDTRDMFCPPMQVQQELPVEVATAFAIPDSYPDVDSYPDEDGYVPF